MIRIKQTGFIASVGALFLGAAGLCGSARVAVAAGSSGDPGPVHFVRLKGYLGDNDKNRKALYEDLRHRDICVEALRLAGLPVSSTPGEEVPEIVKPIEIQMYYAANRTRDESKGESYYWDIDCSIKKRELHTITIRSSAGACKINMLKGTATGVCDESVHAHADPRRLLISPQEMAASAAKLPPDQRKLAERAMAGEFGGPAFPSVGGTKRILGYECTIHHIHLDELCVANPSSSPFKIPRGAASHTPGLLLQSSSPLGTLMAEEVKLNQSAPNDLFRIPPGVKVIGPSSPAAKP